MPQPSVVLSDDPDFFGQPEMLAALLSDRDSADQGQDEVDRQIALAWYLRQRDTAQALSLLQRLRTIFSGWADDITPARHRQCARAALAGAECHRLVAQFEESAHLLDDAIRLFHLASDDVGLGDCALLESDILIGRGDGALGQNVLARAINHYHMAGNATRLALARAILANQQHYSSSLNDENYTDPHLEIPECKDSPGVHAHTGLCLGGMAFQRGDFPQAIQTWGNAFDHAVAAGAILLSIHLATVIGSAYANLFDLPTALEWKEKAYTIAKSTGWPEALGTTLSSMAETTTSIGQHERAHALFAEAMLHLRCLPATRRHFIAYMAYGNLHRVQSRLEEALYWYTQAEPIAERLAHPDMRMVLNAALAATLQGLGRLEEAEMLASQMSSDNTSNNPFYEMESLRVLAGIRWARTCNPTKAIELLQLAITKGEALDGMISLRSDIYDELACAYEAAGDFQEALLYERRGRDSWQRNFDRQNGARIQALQVRFDTARAKAEAEHHRNLAEAEAARAAELDRANQTLDRLGSIGQEITARLDPQAVFDTLSRHLSDLMHANTLFVGLTDDTTQSIDIRFRMEDGQRLPPRRVSMSSDNLSARCVRENEEMLVTWDQFSTPPTVPGTRLMRTVLYRPLALGDRVLGVVSVQSERENAYGPRELLIFRSICSYGAIAMANAEAYQQLDRAVADLREALHRLVQQEKMAALGQLVAGVAHEVNTPLGNALAAVSQLNDNIRGVRNVIAQGGLTRSALTEHLESAQDLSDLAQRNVIRAAEMVRSFKEVAVDRGSDEMRGFELGDYLRETVALMRAKVTGRGNQVTLDVPPIQMQSYPGALAQVMTNLLSNAADHAFPDDGTGTIQIEACMVGAEIVEIRVRDDGQGIDEENLSKIFDPFFTTKRASGHMGLGLHVAFNQVTQRLNGTIDIDSMPGRGTTAIVRIPREMAGSYSSPNNHSQAF